MSKRELWMKIWVTVSYKTLEGTHKKLPKISNFNLPELALKWSMSRKKDSSDLVTKSRVQLSVGVEHLKNVINFA